MLKLNNYNCTKKIYKLSYAYFKFTTMLKNLAKFLTPQEVKSLNIGLFLVINLTTFTYTSLAQSLKPESTQLDSPPNDKVNSSPKNAKPIKLYGRLEEVVNETAPKLPIKLIKMQPQLDGQVETTLKADITKTSYPSDFIGNWSGELRVLQNVVSTKYYEIDQAEATNTKKVLKINMAGNVSFDFYKSNNRISLKPATIYFTIPFNETYMAQSNGFKELGALAQNPNNNNPLMQQMSNMLNQMPATLEVILGNAENVTGVSGNIIRDKLVKNTVTVMNPDVIEQDIVVAGNTENPQTHVIKNNFTESVLKFKKINSRQMYVESASINYTKTGQFLSKLVFQGYVTKNSNRPQKPQQAPNYGNMNNPFDTINKMLAPLGQGQNNYNPSNNQPYYPQNNSPGSNNSNPYIQNYNWHK